ncbi:MAG: hypothetical protein PHT33_13575 [bacterium]|nr:hypothetical protein [bacterium]
MKMTTTWNRILLASILWCGLTLNSFCYATDEASNVLDYNVLCDGTTDDTNAIQAMVNTVPTNTRIVWPNGRTCKINGTISIPSDKQFVLDGNGCKFDLTGNTGTVFTFPPAYHPPSYGPYGKIEIRNMDVTASAANTSTLLVQISDCPGKVVVQNIFFTNLANVVWLLGNCYLSIIDNVRGYPSNYGGGIPIKLTSSDAFPTWGPNNSMISNIWMQPFSGGPGPQCPIYINYSNGVNIKNVEMEGVWQNGITILNSIVNMTGVWLHYYGNDVYTSSTVTIDNAHITGHNFTMLTTDTAVGTFILKDSYIDYAGALVMLYVAGNSDKVDIHDNTIKLTGVYTAVRINPNYTLHDLFMHHNHFEGHGDTLGGLAVEVPSNSTVERLKINDNTFYNMGNSTGYFFLVKAVDGQINDNIFNTITMSSGHMFYSYGNVQLKRNIFNNCTGTFAFAAGDVVKDNTGYVTENTGTATIVDGTSSIVVTHGLTATPTKVFVEGSTSDTTSLYVDTIGSTQFTIHSSGNVGGNRTIYWRAEK